MYFIDAQSLVFGHQNSLVQWLDARFMSDASFELNMENDVARFSLGKQAKQEWLIEKLRKFEIPKAPSKTYDPEILTEEEMFYLKRIGEEKNFYVSIGRQGVFGGVDHIKLCFVPLP
ncbi:hypothetical protein Vadar_025786 [Vaccinium darrowii]|uniref:Uncharacterized protein n=1 Tax=Vaccinium darrowii TaxID=229202 RepID=A0ACB7XCH1_9ERIC|nr:hypothetical protein Vadar_025786 [Vaccinium darrowii]